MRVNGELGVTNDDEIHESPPFQTNRFGVGILGISILHHQVVNLVLLLVSIGKVSVHALKATLQIL